PAGDQSSPASTGSSRSSRRSCKVYGPSAIPYELACFGGCEQNLLIGDFIVEHFFQRAAERAVQRGLRLAHREWRHRRPPLGEGLGFGGEGLVRNDAVEQTELRGFRRRDHARAPHQL